MRRWVRGAARAADLEDGGPPEDGAQVCKFLGFLYRSWQIRGNDRESKRISFVRSTLLAQPDTLSAAMFGPNYGAAQSHIGELMQERDDFIQASKAQARRVAELEASLAAATELHGAAQVPRPPPRSLPVLPHLHCRTPHHLWMRTPGPWLGLSHRSPCLRFG